MPETSTSASPVLPTIEVLADLWERELCADRSPGWHERRRSFNHHVLTLLDALDAHRLASNYLLERVLDVLDSGATDVRTDEALIRQLDLRSTDPSLRERAQAVLPKQPVGAFR